MSEFQIARVKLTAWYILIIILLLGACNLAAISAEQRAFSAILQALGNPTQRPYLTTLLERRILNFETNFRNMLFLFDIIMLFVASVASYFLSGRTLDPIAKMLKQQEEFAADASHELRTPLTTIGIEIEAFKRTEGKIPEKYKIILNDIEVEVKRMKGLVDGLLTIVRDDKSGRSDFQDINLNNVASEVVHQMDHLAKSKQINLKLDGAEQLKILGNRSQIKELLIILVDNAIKFTPDGKSINILLSLSKNSSPTLTVSDQGMGIQKSDLPHIFERFYQGYRPNPSQNQKGSGLGLSIAKKIVDTHKAKISVDSYINEGTTFTIIFPKTS